MASLAGVLSDRLWPILRAASLQAILMIGIVGNIVGWLVLALLVDTLHWLDIDFHGKTLDTISPDGKILGLVILFACNLVLVLAAWRWLEGERLEDMWCVFSRKQWKYLAIGIAAGVVETLLVLGGMVLVGAAKSAWGLARVPAATIPLALGWLFASCVLGPFVEELLYRGYWLQNVMRGWGAVPATVITALLFGAAHLLNPNAEPLGAINIALSGAIYAVSLLWLRSLWLPIGWHAGWNFAESFIAGFPNSGISVSSLGLEGTSLLVSTTQGSPWLSGAAFGMEASLVRTVVLTCALLGLLWLKQKGPLGEKGGGPRWL